VEAGGYPYVEQKTGPPDATFGRVASIRTCFLSCKSVSARQ